MIKKIVLLLVVFNLPLLAFKLDVRDEVNPKDLRDVVRNGWSDKNITFNSLIIKSAKKNLVSFNEKIAHPLLEPKEKDLSYIPRYNLQSDDLLLMLAYTKYLENSGRVQEAKKLYLTILNGLLDIKKLHNSMLKVVMDIVYESYVLDALNQANKEKIYSKEDRKEICKLSLNVFIQNSDDFIEAVKSEQKFLSKVWNKSRDNSKKKRCIISIDYKICNKFKNDVSKKIEIINNKLYKKILKAIKAGNAEEFDKLDAYIKKEQTEIKSTFAKVAYLSSSLQNEAEIKLGIDVKDFGYASLYIAKTYAIIAAPRIKEMFFDYKKRVDKNKKFLKEFGCYEGLK